MRRGYEAGRSARDEHEAYAISPPETGEAVLFGGGVQITCHTWLATDYNRQLGDQWILGYWSGQNARNGRNPQVGATGDGPRILSVVNVECLTHPDQMLVDAVESTYARFDHEGR